MAASRLTRRITVSAVEYVYLFMLWMLCVSKIDRLEIILGLVAAAIGTAADQVVKQIDPGRFRWKVKQTLLIFWEPWYAIDGTAAIFKAFARKLLGKRSEAQFKAVALDAGGDDPESQARRALMIAYMTIPPNFIIIGIDCKRNKMLVHQVSPTPTPLIAKKLGARE
jgi:multisubunit Na+/H+ antiporter MnhE subunit